MDSTYMKSPVGSFPIADCSILWNLISVSSQTLTTLLEGLKSDPLSFKVTKVEIDGPCVDPRAVWQR